MTNLIELWEMGPAIPSRERQHLMAVEGAIQFAREACEAFDADDREMVRLALNRSRDFLGELIAGFRETSTDKNAEHRRQLILDAFRLLAEAEGSDDMSLIQKAVRRLSEHRDECLKVGEVSSDEESAGRPSFISWLP